MRTQLSSSIVAHITTKTHVRLYCTNGPTFVMASYVHVFKEVYQRTNFSQITYKASSGMDGERLHVVFGLTGICIDLQWEKLKR